MDPLEGSVALVISSAVEKSYSISFVNSTQPILPQTPGVLQEI